MHLDKAILGICGRMAVGERIMALWNGILTESNFDIYSGCIWCSNVDTCDKPWIIDRIIATHKSDKSPFIYFFYDLLTSLKKKSHLRLYKNTVKVQQTIKLLGKSLQCHRASSKKCVSKNCILKEKNEKKRGNLTLLKTIKRDNALNRRRTTIHRREWREFVSFNSARFPAYRCTEWMHACTERLQQSILGYMQRPDTLAFPPLQNISVGCRGYARYFIRLYASWAYNNWRTRRESRSWRQKTVTRN